MLGDPESECYLPSGRSGARCDVREDHSVAAIVPLQQVLAE